MERVTMALWWLHGRIVRFVIPGYCDDHVDQVELNVSRCLDHQFYGVPLDE